MRWELLLLYDFELSDESSLIMIVIVANIHDVHISNHM